MRDEDTERAWWDVCGAVRRRGSLMLEMEFERLRTAELGCGMAELKLRPPRVWKAKGRLDWR